MAGMIDPNSSSIDPFSYAPTLDAHIAGYGAQAQTALAAVAAVAVASLTPTALGQPGSAYTVRPGVATACGAGGSGSSIPGEISIDPSF